jgi:hypothetical protein
MQRTSILRNPELIRAEAERLAAHLARVTHMPAHIVSDNGHLLICDDIDIALWGTDQIVFTVEPELVYDSAA